MYELVDFHAYPRLDEYLEAWGKIDDLLQQCWDALVAKAEQIEEANNVFVVESTAAEDFIRQAFQQLDRIAAERGSFRRVDVINFKDGRGDLRVDIRGGYATLPITSEQYIPLSKVRISWSNSTSTALPGNLAEIIGWEQISTNGLRTPLFRIGGGNPQSVGDGSVSTHFEWERSVVDNPQRLIGNDGTMDSLPLINPFMLISPDRWSVVVPERGPEEVTICADGRRTRGYGERYGFEGPLRLTLLFETSSPTRPNYIDIVPFYPAHGRVSPFVVDGLNSLVGDGRSLITREFNCDRPRSIQLDPSTSSKFSISFTQKAPYRTLFGHRFLRRRGDTEPRGFWNLATGEAGGLVRIVPTENEVVPESGMDLVPEDDISQEVVEVRGRMPSYETLRTARSLAQRQEEAAQAARDNELLEDWDVFSGERWAIGIKEIQLVNREFGEAAVGEFGPIEYTEPCSYLSVGLSKTIPEYFGEGDWIRIFISPNGTSWEEVEENELKEFPHDRVFIRVRLTRPSGESGGSPLLHQINVYTT